MLGVTISLGSVATGLVTNQFGLTVTTAGAGAMDYENSAGIQLSYVFATSSSNSGCPTYGGVPEGNVLQITVYDYGSRGFSPTTMVVNSTAYFSPTFPMLRKAIWALALVVSLAVPATVKAQGDYLDVYRVKVKPEKLGDFYALSAKWIDANRQNGGDRWIALETVYGEGEVFQFNSTRSSYADVDKMNDAVMAAAAKAFGADMMKTMLDFENCIASSRTEFRRRRGDLSRNLPADSAAYAKLVGTSRYLRTTAVHVRPGKIVEFEGLLKDLKAAYEKNPNAPPVFVSQVIEGTKGTLFYISTWRSSMAGFDKNPSMRDLLGDDGYKKFQQGSADVVEEADSTMYRVSRELSNPSDEVAAVAPDFWHPKH